MAKVVKKTKKEENNKKEKYNADNEIIIGVTTKPKEKVRVENKKSTRTNQKKGDNSKNKKLNNKKTSNKIIPYMLLCTLMLCTMLVIVGCGGTKKEDYNNLSKKIDIVVPNNIEHIEIDNVNTNINFDELNLEEVEINNVNGNINVNYLKCDDFECDIVNGDIKFNKMDIFDLDLKRVNGDLTINEIVDSKERVDLKVSNVDEKINIKLELI